MNHVGCTRPAGRSHQGRSLEDVEDGCVDVCGISEASIPYRSIACRTFRTRRCVYIKVMQAPLTALPDVPDALTRAREGDPGAFAEAIRRHHAIVFGLALH